MHELDAADKGSSSALFVRYRPVIKTLPQHVDMTPELLESLLLSAEDKTAVYYAPMDYVNPSAKIVIVGITPGPTQMVASLETAGQAIRDGLEETQVLRSAKGRAAFRGMRDRLSEMLAFLGISTWLEAAPGDDHFESLATQIQSTSAVRYPTFVQGKPFDGDPTRTPMLRAFVERGLAAELSALPEALVMPLGRNSGAAVNHLVNQGSLDPRRCVIGIPHPSPANGHYTKLWSARRNSLRDQVEAWLRVLGQ